MLFLPFGESAYAEPVGDWVLTCDPRPCELTQSARNDADGEVVKITLTRREQGLFALVAVPLGISLPAGVTLSVDQGASSTHQFATCTVGGCFSAIPLAGQHLAAWKKGKTLRIVFGDGAGQPVDIAVSLIGLTQGLEELNARKE